MAAELVYAWEVIVAMAYGVGLGVVFALVLLALAIYFNMSDDE